LHGALNDTELRQRQLAEIKKVIATHRNRLPLVLVTHGSVISDLTVSISGWASLWFCGGRPQ
jgi:broad specificity phosphatase PhoE